MKKLSPEEFQILLQERFFLSAENNPNGCWKWTGRKNRKGYGIFSVGSKQFIAHRFSYELYVGEIPEGFLVCHKCDNPECCKPSHLFIGTAADNNKDRAAKGRSSKSPRSGQKNNRTSLTNEMVIQMRKEYEDGEYNLKYLALKYNIGSHQVYMIVTRRAWKDI